MSKFHFRLDGVLRHRRHVEQERQRDLAKVQTQVSQLESELRALSDAAQFTTDDLRAHHLTGRLDLGFLAAHRRYMLGVQRKAGALSETLAVLQQQAHEARKNLAEAAKQRKILEKLRERQREQWAADIARRESAETDEIGMQITHFLSAADDAAAPEPIQPQVP